MGLLAYGNSPTIITRQGNVAGHGRCSKTYPCLCDVNPGRTSKCGARKARVCKDATTLDVYSHVIPSFQKETSDRFDLALELV